MFNSWRIAGWSYRSWSRTFSEHVNRYWLLRFMFFREDNFRRFYNLFLFWVFVQLKGKYISNMADQSNGAGASGMRFSCSSLFSFQQARKLLGCFYYLFEEVSLLDTKLRLGVGCYFMFIAFDIFFVFQLLHYFVVIIYFLDALFCIPYWIDLFSPLPCFLFLSYFDLLHLSGRTFWNSLFTSLR